MSNGLQLSEVRNLLAQTWFKVQMFIANAKIPRLRIFENAFATYTDSAFCLGAVSCSFYSSHQIFNSRIVIIIIKLSPAKMYAVLLETIGNPRSKNKTPLTIEIVLHRFS